MPRTDSDSNMSHDSGASFDDLSSDRLDSLGVPCMCPCGRKNLFHILSPLPNCLAMRHSCSQNFPTIKLAAVTSRQNKKEAIEQMKQYFSFETKKLKNEYESFAYAVYLYAKSIHGIEDILKRILKIREKFTDSNEFEYLYDEVTAGANPIDYDIMSSLFDKLLKEDRNNETEHKDKAKSSFEKYHDAYQKCSQYRVFSSQGDILEERPPIQQGVYKMLMLKVEETSQTFRFERILQLKYVVKRILKIPEWVQLRVVSLNEGCVEISFEVIGSFDFDLNLDQRQDLISNNITLLEYAGKVHYCCCELLQDEVQIRYFLCTANNYGHRFMQKSCDVVKKIYDNVYQSDCQINGKFKKYEMAFNI